MGKKSRRRQSASATADVHALYPEDSHWDPLKGDDDRYGNGQRDQRYVKNVSPRSEGQKQLMEAIDRHNLVMALGPAGTGKTYLAIAKAVEAFEKGQCQIGQKRLEGQKGHSLL